MFTILLKGLIIGFAIAAPVGPIGVLCIQRSLQNGFKIGLFTGLGAAVADGVYGLIAGFGLTAISSFLLKEQMYIRVGGGVFLLYLGFKLLFKKATSMTVTIKPDKSARHAFFSTFFLTLTNPMTILSFIAIFAGLGVGNISMDYFHAVFLVMGIVLGSAAWWFLLSGGVALVLHHRISPSNMTWINRFSGTVMLLFGASALLG